METILFKTLNEMTFIFSSNSFSNRAKKNGLTKQQINNGAISHFLHLNAIRDGSRRMWKKKNYLTDQQPISEKIKEAIELLKSHGYKIMKPINDWIEI
jgi:hypothetical protein